HVSNLQLFKSISVAENQPVLVMPSIPQQIVQVKVVPCDDTASCPDGSTCCKTKEGKWACCPLPEAVCCADGSHCCPQNYKCNEQATSCVKGEVEIPWYTKLPALTSDQSDLSAVQCDGGTQCPEHTTCCKLATGEWGCCPDLEFAILY
uniref:Granulin a n=1 Tax=Acanthochromis polyacanthus TaxID=80966 RepID=A0A3Q1GWW9_9TELE